MDSNLPHFILRLIIAVLLIVTYPTNQLTIITQNANGSITTNVTSISSTAVNSGNRSDSGPHRVANDEEMGGIDEGEHQNPMHFVDRMQSWIAPNQTPSSDTPGSGAAGNGTIGLNSTMEPLSNPRNCSYVQVCSLTFAYLY